MQNRCLLVRMPACPFGFNDLRPDVELAKFAARLDALGYDPQIRDYCTVETFDLLHPVELQSGLLDAAAAREVHDTCLYTALAEATGARGNSTALVGTPETVAEAMVAYYDLGATHLLIRGYDPLPDAIEYGEELIPRVRALVAERDSKA